MDKHYEAVKEILEDQIKKIVKKGDISPQELDNLYKASAICLDFETKEAMKKSQEQGQGYSQDGSYEMNRRGRSYANENHDGSQSNHYPWFMYGGSMGDMSNRGNSYGPVWNQDMENKSMHELHSQDYGNSNKRGVRGTGRKITAILMIMLMTVLTMVHMTEVMMGVMTVLTMAL